ncbi:MAG: hypothetical protein V2I57_09315 [Xanthomonadales bacterium]|jgi:hypothetical protein|nr:hypothetical protein [Xanthomonadales bacterium]
MLLRPSCAALLAAATLFPVSPEAFARSAEITCDSPQSRIPTTVSLVAPLNGDFNPVGGGQLAWIDVLWLADEQTDRLREYVTVDWRDESLSAVQVFDVALGGVVQDDVAPTRLVPGSDFASGRMDFDFCMPRGATHGLAVA